MVKKLLRLFFETVKLTFIVLCFFIVCLFFCQIRVPTFLVNAAIDAIAPTNLVVCVDSVKFGISDGIELAGIDVYERDKLPKIDPLVSAEIIKVNFLRRQVESVGLTYKRLPESYYAPGNLEKNSRIEARFPTVDGFHLKLIKPDILGVAPRELVCDIEISKSRFSADRIHLDWPNAEERMYLDGYCIVDLEQQLIDGEVKGTAKQSHIRPLLVALDLPSAMPYFDGFTDVPCKVPAACSWKVNLVNNDFDLFLDLKPTLGRYNSVPMKFANGKIHLHVYTRGTYLNYRQTIGPIHGVGTEDQPLDGTVIVSGTNGYNTVDVTASSALPVADLLKIGGFTGEYVGNDVFGETSCRLQFRFPRSMTNNYEVLNGFGHVEIKDGQVMRMKGFRGLVKLLAEKVPGVSLFTDATQASCDYIIENGIIKSDNIYIEGTVFSIKMNGYFDATKNLLNYSVRVQFMKNDTISGKIVHPITWPITKLFLEFKLTGTPDNPQWEYVSILDRVIDTAQEVVQ